MNRENDGGRAMSGQDEGAIHGLARAYESVMAEGFGCCKDAIRAQLAAIRDGKVPGVEMMHPDQVCSARILNEQIASLRAQLAAAKAEGERVRGEREAPRAYYDEHMVDPDTGKDCVEPNVVVVTEGGNHYFEMATDRAGRALAEKLTRIFEGLRAERDALLETLGRDGQYLKTEATEEERSIEGAAYRGRSVYAWWAKAHAYGCMVHGINPILGAREGEHANDAARRVVAERDAALLRVGEAEGMLREAMEDMKPSVRFRKDEHGEMRAVPGYVCLLKRIEGFLGGVGGEGS